MLAANQKTILNDLRMRAAGALLDGPAALRNYLVQCIISNAPPLAALLADSDALNAYLRSTAIGTWHASGTCRMGRHDDADAVVDRAGRVRGLSRLRVADASLMPDIPSANTNLPTLMIAEKIADHILHN